MRASSLLLATAAATAALALPLSTAARPSLVDLDADLGQVVDGLCHGDAALCGEDVPTAVAGQLDFDAGTFQMDFRSLRFAYTKPSGGSFAFDDLTATVDTAGLTAILAGELASGTLYDVDVIVPDPSGPGNVTLLSLQNVAIEGLVVDASGATASITLSFGIAQMSWMGSSSSWNVGLGSGSGCTTTGGDKHVALAGSSPSLLAPGEIETHYQLVLAGSGPAFAFERAPSPSSACYLRTIAMGSSTGESFQRLSPLSDTFATPLYDETIEFTTGVTESYSLTVEGSEMREHFVYAGSAGTLTSRSFSPVDGSLVNEFSQPL